MEQIYNPYLPLNEYVPDGEPHVFGDRVYIYGSHDAIDATAYCEGHYVTWSAPVDNLKDWKYEGVIYRRDQDPSNADDKMQLWAPDVTQGPDGRYYLYYCFSFYPEIGVAVSDSPAGPFEFYGHVKYPESINGGAVVKEFMPFDPAVLTDDDGRVYLYYGFAPGGEKPMELPEFTEEDLAKMAPDQREVIENVLKIEFGKASMVVELEPDMVTTKEVPRELILSEKRTAGTDFEGHGFFEASSIRKFGDTYYFVYSSHKSHELCYATSRYPDRDFKFGGTIISNGDIGLNGRTVPVATTGNNHGGLVEVNGQTYIFYHRPTDGTEYSRQGCAEPVVINADGSIDQVEMTSCGLNGGPLTADGSYPAVIACHMRSPKSLDIINYDDPRMKEQTRSTQSQNVNYITDITGGTVLGYKYFEFSGASSMTMEIRGDFDGTVKISLDAEGKQVIGEADLSVHKADWTGTLIPITDVNGKQAVYLTFAGNGNMDFKRFGFLDR